MFKYETTGNQLQSDRVEQPTCKNLFFRVEDFLLKKRLVSRAKIFIYASSAEASVLSPKGEHKSPSKVPNICSMFRRLHGCLSC